MRPRLSWVAVPAVGAAVVLWSVATMAGLYSMGNSLTAASESLPQSLSLPRTVALADSRRALANSWAPALAASRQRQVALLNQCDAACLRLASSFAHDGKMARLRPAASTSPAAVAPNAIALVTPRDARFDSVVAKAKLSPQKLAAAFAVAASHPSGAPFMLASLPTDARFAGIVGVADKHGPAPARFGPEVAEIERSSRLALALANTLPEVSVDVTPSVALAAVDPVAAQELQPAEVQMASLPPQDDLPDNIPLPGRRPQAEIDQPAQAPKAEAPAKVKPPKAAKAQTSRVQTAEAATIYALPGVQSPRSSSQPAVPTIGKPIKRSKAQAAEMLAFAKPDAPAGGVGRAFKDLFATPNMGNGVAIYDISAKTVYMPDGSRLEAHSGIGSMADQPRYANRKNVGPTPPGTYDLKLRETRFHGVEAIRLTPTGGSNQYGRDGLLAHSYLLRGGRAESHGCVAFKDYARFLAAYKKGKIKRLVVVPRMSRPLKQVASDGGRA